jgi:hypothetical protein
MGDLSLPGSRYKGVLAELRNGAFFMSALLDLLFNIPTVAVLKEQSHSSASKRKL